MKEMQCGRPMANILLTFHATGEFEIYIANQDGSGQPVQPTKRQQTYIFNLDCRPIARKFCFITETRIELCGY